MRTLRNPILVVVVFIIAQSSRAQDLNYFEAIYNPQDNSFTVNYCVTNEFGNDFICREMATYRKEGEVYVSCKDSYATDTGCLTIEFVNLEMIVLKGGDSHLHLQRIQSTINNYRSKIHPIQDEDGG